MPRRGVPGEGAFRGRKWLCKFALLMVRTSGADGPRISDTGRKEIGTEYSREADVPRCRVTECVGHLYKGVTYLGCLGTRESECESLSVRAQWRESDEACRVFRGTSGGACEALYKEGSERAETFRPLSIVATTGQREFAAKWKCINCRSFVLANEDLARSSVEFLGTNHTIKI